MKLKLMLGLATATLALAACGGAGSTKDGDQEGGQARTVEMGKRVALADLSFAVLSAEQQAAIRTAGKTYQPKEGSYLLVRMDLGNRRSDQENARLLAEQITLLGGDGNEYAINDSGSEAFESSLGPHTHDPAKFDPRHPSPLYGFLEVPPGMIRLGVAVFDLPPEAIPNAKLEIKAAGSGATFDLGL